ncbi:reverse transcriptase domain-containing protein [Tanacetum coccineum]
MLVEQGKENMFSYEWEAPLGAVCNLASGRLSYIPFGIFADSAVLRFKYCSLTQWTDKRQYFVSWNLKHPSNSCSYTSVVIESHKTSNSSNPGWSPESFSSLDPIVKVSNCCFKRFFCIFFDASLPPNLAFCAVRIVLNWEKCHFMCREGIVLGHKISKSGIEVDRAKVDVIAKLPHPTTVKGVRSFLGHAGFYRRFIQDFSKIARPMTHLLEKETPFVFSKDCIDAFQTLKKKLTKASIFVVPDWNLPFELMCDASDFAIGAVLGQRKTKHFQPIHYASKTMTEAQIHYTTTEKEMLAVVYAFEVTAFLTVGENRTSWSDKLDEALWAFRTAFKTPIGYTPYKLVYGKSCHLPIELEDKAYWALKHANFDLKTVGDHRKLQLNELNELRDQAYENSLIYKERTKKLHDSKIKNRIFNVGDRVLLFNSHLKIFLGKLKTRWSGPFTITKVFPYGTIKLSQPDGLNFKVNGHRVKHYFGGDLPTKVVQDLYTLSKDE